MSLPGNQISPKVVPRTRALIGLKGLEPKIKYIAGKSKFSYGQLIQFIQDIMNETLELTIQETKEWIWEFVPLRSGDLQDNLIEFLEKSKPPPSNSTGLRNVRLILGAGKDVKYARYVNEMDASMVQHNNTWLEHSGFPAYSKGVRVLLHDPDAVGFFFDKMVAYAVERLKINLKKIKWVKIR